MLPITPGTRSFQRKARDSNPQAAHAATCFQDRLLIRPDAFHLPISSGGWNRTNGLLVQSQASLPAATIPHRSTNQDSERSSRFATRSTPSGNRTRPASFKGSRRDYAPERVPCGSRTRLTRLEAWSLCRSAKSTSWKRKVRESNPSRRSSRSTAFEAAAVASRLALP